MTLRKNSYALGALCLFWVAAGCGDDDDGPIGGRGGGHSGAGEAGESSGGTSSGGASAKGGSSSGGKAGSGGGSGTAAAGTAGESGGGAGGATGGATSGGTAGAPLGGEAGFPTTGGSAGASGGSAPIAGDAGAGGDAGAAGGPITSPFSPLPAVPADPTNAFADNAKAATFGQRLFFDKAFSGPISVTSSAFGQMGESGKISCFSCHDGSVLDDTKSTPPTVSIGTGLHTRNSPTLVNSVFYKWTNWGGRFSAQWELPIAVVENPATMNGNRLALAHRIFDRYKDDYEEIFGALEPAIGSSPTRFPASGKPKPSGAADGAWEGMTEDDRKIVNRILANYAKALNAYIRKLVVRDTNFDRYVGGNTSALSESAQRGLALFQGKAACDTCHAGPHFSDDAFHNLGVPQPGTDNIPTSDDGRFKDLPGLINSPFNSAGDFSDDKPTGLLRLQGLTNSPPDSMKGQFRTASLRGIAESGPYMHSGQFATLEAVIDFYDVGGGTPVSGTKDPALLALNLSTQEKTDLVEFLKSLSLATPVPASLLQDTAAQP